MARTENSDFSKFGKAFQEGLAQLIMEQRAFADQLQEVLAIDFFELKYLQVFTRKIFEFKKKYGVHPSKDAMLTVFRAELEDENASIQKQTRDFFARIYKSEIEIGGEEYIKETALDFCRKQKLKEAMIQSVGLLETSSFDEISSVINDALKLGASTDFGYDYKADFEERFTIKARNPVSSGWQIIDDHNKGGLGSGELGVVIAPTGAGKSMVLVHLGTEALKQGKTVIHYTLELGSTVIASRYDSCMTGIPISQLFSCKEGIYETVKELEGQLIIKEYPTKTASPNVIRNHLERLHQRDIKPDLIIVDYADLLRPNVIRKEKRHELETIYEDLRGIAQECKCPCYTASQTNRSGLNAEVITMESISEAFNKCFVADFIFSFSRTIEDKNTNGGRVFIAKNRNGPDGLIFPIFMDPSRVKIKILPPNGQTIESVHAHTAVEQGKQLREKYKEFRKK
jgi:archaellum biogenesis ATPase FlaH